MSCDPQAPPPVLPPYTPVQSVFRAVIHKDWLKHNNTRVHHKLFVRFKKDTSGVSVSPTPEYCLLGLTGEVFGIAVLAVADVRSIQKNSVPVAFLDVIPDSPTHANIQELPDMDEDRNEAIRLAKLLAEQALVHDHYLNDSWAAFIASVRPPRED